MSCPSEKYTGGEASNIGWSNWAGRVAGPVGTFFWPGSLPELVNIVVRASTEGHRLRVVGSGWGFEDIAYSPDWMVSLERLKNPLTAITASALNSQWAMGKPERIYR